MKRKLCFVLAWLLLFSLAACGGGGTAEDDPSPVDDPNTTISTAPVEDPDFSEVLGGWINSARDTVLQINDAGQVWYIQGDEVLFRGYLEQEAVTDADHSYQYNFYNEADELLTRYYYSQDYSLLMEHSLEDTITEEYTYIGEFDLDGSLAGGVEDQIPTEIWYIQGVSDAYCLALRDNETWQLRYPGAEGEVLCEGVSVPDPFGDLELIIDEATGASLGKMYQYEGDPYFSLPISDWLEPFGHCNFYREEDSAPRISVGDYTGWWYSSDTQDMIEIADDGTWRVEGFTEGEDAVTGTYEVADSGIVLTVDWSDTMYFQEGAVFAFDVQDTCSLYDSESGFTLVPSYGQLF